MNESTHLLIYYLYSYHKKGIHFHCGWLVMLLGIWFCKLTYIQKYYENKMISWRLSKQENSWLEWLGRKKILTSYFLALWSFGTLIKLLKVLKVTCKGLICIFHNYSFAPTCLLCFFNWHTISMLLSNALHFCNFEI